ncbi:MAG TPA: YigZ family protein [Bacteroidota bacterium]|nr:YigZ family protein [Bacteroidota bacterium]
MKDEYRSVKSESSKILKVEGSKFIASISPVESQTGAEEFLDGKRKEYFDATHHCFAYACGSEREEFRYSDDGEPSGTAGAKIFGAIQSQDVSDLIVVVTRYFGGTKLGVGGLGRAYFDAANLVISSSVIVQKVVAEELRITFPFEETNGVMTVLSRTKVRIVDTVYDEEVTLRISARRGAVKDLVKDLVNVTRGNLVSKVLLSGPRLS